MEFRLLGVLKSKSLAKNQHNPRKLLYFVNKPTQNVPISYFGCQKPTDFFFISEYQFRRPFLVKKIFPTPIYRHFFF